MGRLRGHGFVLQEGAKRLYLGGRPALEFLLGKDGFELTGRRHDSCDGWLRILQHHHGFMFIPGHAGTVTHHQIRASRALFLHGRLGSSRYHRGDHVCWASWLQEREEVAIGCHLDDRQSLFTFSVPSPKILTRGL